MREVIENRYVHCRNAKPSNGRMSFKPIIETLFAVRTMRSKLSYVGIQHHNIFAVAKYLAVLNLFHIQAMEKADQCDY